MTIFTQYKEKPQHLLNWEIIDNIAKSIVGQSFDEWGGYVGIYKRLKDVGYTESRSDALNCILPKKRKLEMELGMKRSWL